MSGYDIIVKPVTTEKAVRLLEAENLLLLVVDKRADKPSIKKAVEEVFKVKVVGVRTHITWKGIKRAYVRLSYDSPAMDVITQLGLM